MGKTSVSRSGASGPAYPARGHDPGKGRGKCIGRGMGISRSIGRGNLQRHDPSTATSALMNVDSGNASSRSACAGLIYHGLPTSQGLKATFVLVTSDHGGVGKGHGKASMAEIEIPWILWGPGVAKGRKLEDPVNTYDTVATIAHAFGLRTPKEWIARPVVEAFEAKRGE